jgi:NAD(P)-dependent dehydrogenase (short-subunit alcohol dehydrogenase family)
VPTDVGKNDEVEELAANTVRDFGGFDVWVNNAGVLLVGRLDEAPVEDFERVIQTNLLGVAYGSRVAVTHFRKKGRGTLVNVASIVGGLGRSTRRPTPPANGACAASASRSAWSCATSPTVHVCTVMPPRSTRRSSSTRRTTPARTSRRWPRSTRPSRWPR